MESYRKWKKENREKNFIITGWQISRYDENFTPIKTEGQLIQGQEMDNYSKVHDNSLFKIINQKNVTRRKNRHSRTKNGKDSRLGIWNNVSQRTLAPHLKCWEEHIWLRILYPRKIHIKNKIKYFLRHTTIARLHHHQQTNLINVF